MEITLAPTTKLYQTVGAIHESPVEFDEVLRVVETPTPTHELQFVCKAELAPAVKSH